MKLTIDLPEAEVAQILSCLSLFRMKPRNRWVETVKKLRGKYGYGGDIIGEVEDSEIDTIVPLLSFSCMISLANHCGSIQLDPNHFSNPDMERAARQIVEEG